jgi:hypothetical protein
MLDYEGNPVVTYSLVEPQGANVSLGRENSIECLRRAEASDKGMTQSRQPAPLNITLCHEGFEIQ